MNAPSMIELTRVFGRIGLMSFGGPAAQIALMHRELVETRPWLSEESYLRALSLCMLLPGPEAMQLATYAGWRLRGVPGGILAGVLFVLPGALVIAALVAVYVTWGSVPFVQAAFLGIKAAVIVIVLAALRGLAGRALKHRTDWVIAFLSFAGIFALGVPFPLLIALAAVWGSFQARNSSPAVMAPMTPGLWSSTVRTVAIWATLWLVPLAALTLFEGGLLAQIGWFFAWLATISFGGAYALLAYMAQTVAGDFSWITPAQMIDALGLAETTPGPLILVTQFVAMLAGFGTGGFGHAIAAAIVGLWATFVPCFLWIFAAAPHMERLSNAPRLQAALGAVTAAVVGVILNLSVWFALNVFFAKTLPAPGFLPALTLPDLSSLSISALLLFLIAAGLMFSLRASLPVLLAVCAAAGVALAALGA